MKNILIAFVLLFSFQINAQIPDSLDIDLPWQFINLSVCGGTMGEGPTTDNDTFYIALDSDSTYLDDTNECLFRIKNWKILDWVSGEVYDFPQVGKVKDYANTQCETDLYINHSEFPYTLGPDNLLLDLNVDHEYSFSYSDEIVDQIIIDESSADNQEIYVYDRTDSTLCKTNVYVTFCEEDISLVFPETVEIEFNGEFYIDLTLEMLGVEIDYPCGSYTTKIRVGNTSNSLLFSQNVGNIVPVRIELEFSDNTKYIKYINVNVTGVKPPPIPMFIEEVDFSAGESIELDIWSEDVLGMLAWQLQLQFENVEILGIETSDMFEDIPSNILNENTLRSLWFPSNGMAIDVESNATWYTLLLKPEIDGSTYDIFTTAHDPWSRIAAENENYAYEYEVDFIFNIAPRNVLGVNGPTTISNIDVFPNPCLDIINIKGMIEKGVFTEVEVMDLSGKIILNREMVSSNQDVTVDVSTLPAGLFILKIRNGESIYTQKLIKI